MLMLYGWGESLIRTIIFGLDKTIYKFIPTIYDFVQVLAKQQLLDQPTLQGFANNIYALLAVFMLFRLAFVLLNAIIDPDKLTNKDKGFGKIMSRFITGIFLIVLIPWAFEYAFKLQDMILSGNLMTKVVFGSGTDTSSSAGYTLAKTALQAFYYCDDATGVESEPDENGNVIVRYNCDLDNGYTRAFSDKGDNGLRKQGWASLSENLNKEADEGNDYKFNYSAFISTACGIVILLMLITLSIDVAVRVVKLSFLQLITPVAVAGYIEPGGKRFQEWLKVTTTTYLNLFIRLLAISVVAYIISLVDPSKFTPVDLNGKVITNFMQASFVRIFIIIGCLLFAKEAPKMLTDILGVKEAGLGGLNPFKKLGGMVGAGFIGGAAALGMKGVGGLAGGVRGGMAAKGEGGSFWAGAGQGAKTGFKNIKLKDAYKGGITGIGKSLSAGTVGAWGKGRDYAASKVTGKEEKLGLINNIKKGMASTANEMHIKAGEKDDKARWFGAKDSPETGLKYTASKDGDYKAYSKNYADQLRNIKKAKDEVKSRENARSYWQMQYQNNPDAEWEVNGKKWNAREVYEAANSNYVTAQKNLENENKELDRMNKMDAYKSDAELKEFADRMSAKDDAAQIASELQASQKPISSTDEEKPRTKIQSIPEYGPKGPSNSSSNLKPNSQSNFKTENGEVKTKSGIVMPGGFNPNDSRNKK